MCFLLIKRVKGTKYKKNQLVDSEMLQNRQKDNYFGIIQVHSLIRNSKGYIVYELRSSSILSSNFQLLYRTANHLWTDTSSGTRCSYLCFIRTQSANWQLILWEKFQERVILCLVPICKMLVRLKRLLVFFWDLGRFKYPLYLSL